MTTITACFPLGRCCMTASINHEITEGNIPDSLPLDLIRRHAMLDCDSTPDDKEANLEAAKNGGRIFSGFNSNIGRIYVITEAGRSYTTVGLMSDY